jgi:Fic family protein
VDFGASLPTAQNGKSRSTPWGIGSMHPANEIKPQMARECVPPPLIWRVRQLKDDYPLDDVLDPLIRLDQVERTVGDWWPKMLRCKEAVLTTQLSGSDLSVWDFIVSERMNKPVDPVAATLSSNYLAALGYAHRSLERKRGKITLESLRLTHQRLMRKVDGASQSGGVWRDSSTAIECWPGGTRCVPPQPTRLAKLLDELEKWLNRCHEVPPLVRAGLAHAQWMMVRPFRDGNRRMGQILFGLVLGQHWKSQAVCSLSLSAAFMQRRHEYAQRLASIKRGEERNAWVSFFLDCLRSSAEAAIATAMRASQLVREDRQAILRQHNMTVPTLCLLESLPDVPVITLKSVTEKLGTTKPTAQQAIAKLCAAGILKEITGGHRNRIYSYESYLRVFTHT